MLGSRYHTLWLILFLPIFVTLFAICVEVSADGVSVHSVRLTPTTNSLTLQAVLANAGQTAVAGRVQLSIAEPDGHVVYNAWLPDNYTLAAGASQSLQGEFFNLPVEPWWPEKPALYDVTIAFTTANGELTRNTVRTGFRTFVARDGRFYLNGLPYFIRGAQYTPMLSNGTDPKLAESIQAQPDFPSSLLGYLRAANINLTKTPFQDLADTLGIMNFGNGDGGYAMSPHYEKPIPAGPALDTLRKSLEENVMHYYNHPSFVMPVFWNEAEKSTGISAFLAQVRQLMRGIDTSRPVVANLGFGRGENADVDSAHWYWGYHSASSELFRVRTAGALAELQRKSSLDQPFILTETGGNYTDERGEFPYARTGQFPIPDLIWIGRSHQVKEDSLEYQAITVKEMAEGFRRARSPQNRISGVVMFTSPFFFSDGKQLTPKPAYDELRIAMQPVLVSADMWKWHYYSGDTLRTGIHIVHDDVMQQTLPPGEVRIRLVASDGTLLGAAVVSTPQIDYYTNWQGTISIPVPMVSTATRLRMELEYVAGDAVLSENHETIFVAPEVWVKADPNLNSVALAVLDPNGGTAQRLTAMGVRYTRISSLDDPLLANAGRLIVGLGALPVYAVTASREQLKSFAERGGRVLVLRQSFNAGLLLPLSVELANSKGHSFMGVDRIEHPLYSGLEQSDFRFWSDASGEDLYTSGQGFRLRKVDELRQLAVWGTMGAMQQDIVIGEYLAPNSEGSIIIDNSSDFTKSEFDPLAGRFSANMVNYLRQPRPSWLAEINGQVQFGEFFTEKGIISSEELQGWKVQPNRRGRVLTGVVKANLDNAKVSCGHLFFQLQSKPTSFAFELMHPTLSKGVAAVFVNGKLVLQTTLRFGKSSIQVDVSDMDIDPKAVQVTIALTRPETVVLGFTPGVAAQ